MNTPATTRSRGLRALGALAGLALAPTALAEPMVVLGSNLYYTDGGHVIEIDTHRQTIERFAKDISARQILVDAEKNLYATSLAYDARTDMFRPTVWQLRGAQTKPAQVASSEQFTYSDVADANGRLFFWQHDPSRGLSRILYRDKKGALLLLAGHKIGHADGQGAQARLGRIGAMAAAQDGALYVTDEQSVRRISPDGVVTTLARGGLLSLGAGRTPSNHLTSIAVDERGLVYLADTATHRILAVDSAGAVTTLSDNDAGWIPRSLAWTNGALYLLETKDKITRAVRLDADGGRHQLAPGSGASATERPIWLSDASLPARPSVVLAQHGDTP